MGYIIKFVFTILIFTTVVKGQQQGDLCVVARTGQPGVCTPILSCSVALEAALHGKLQQACASPQNKGVIVCCPWVPGQEQDRCQANIPTPREGSHCTLKQTEIAGVCRPFANCHTAQEAASKGILPQKCDLTDNESELVCCSKADCPPLPKGLVTQLPIGSKAADYCIELAEKIHPCQETPSGWTRGDMCPLLTPDLNIDYHFTTMTTTADAPYYGYIGEGQIGAIIWERYAVSLVSDRWVLCSAYVIVEVGPNNVKFVGLGGNFTPKYNPDEIYGVTKTYIHPLYNRGYAYNNIGLLLLDRRVTFTSRILPACLHTGTSLPNSGFILTDIYGHKTTMQRVSQGECSRELPPGSDGHPDGVKHEMEMCIRAVNTTGECPFWYDGAALTVPNSPRVACTHLLVGLRSWARTLSCAYPTTRISGFIPWIENIVWPKSGVVD